MAHLCDDSPDSLDVRLSNRSSDDSLILDDNNTGGLWADSENEPATFQVHLKQHSSSFSEHPNNAADIQDGWFRIKPWNEHAPKTAAMSGSTQNVYSMLMQDRSSLSGEESEAPLLSSESWVPGGFSEDTRHCHASSDMSHNNSAWRRLMSATVLCLFFMIAEFFGGLFAGSGAIMSDAAHLLSDLVGLLVSLSAVWLRQRPPTKTLSFGFYRAEVLGALFSVFIIWVLTGIFVYIAILRVIHGDFDIRPDRMMAVAAGGIVINVIMGLVLHGGCQLVPHSHGFGHHGHSHGIAVSHGDNNHQTPSCQHRTNNRIQENSSAALETDVLSKHSNINVRAAVIHVLGDLIQSIGVFIAAIVIKFNPDAKIADPICTFLFAIVVLATTIPLVRDTGLILLEGFPRTIGYSHVFSTLSDIPGVQHVHSLHVWSLTAGKHALAVHLALDSAANRDLITARAQYLLQTKFGIDFCTIQTESFDRTTMNSCFQCKPPVN
ncbi:zinc transporter 2-like [Thrips palmi]|uniref:Zinc transporter 2-like n=1 Tax=Thrips palmi TaxID=161013 RepID=A0A6P8YTJ6_THRPL|nr:zinc transporter 2-like [Thrips palmi]